jgi:hypothetical protein
LKVNILGVLEFVNKSKKSSKNALKTRAI